MGRSLKANADHEALIRSFLSDPSDEERFEYVKGATLAHLALLQEPFRAAFRSCLFALLRLPTPFSRLSPGDRAARIRARRALPGFASVIELHEKLGAAAELEHALRAAE